MYALISTVSPGPVLKRGSEFVQLAEAKGLKWVPDNPPSFDAAKQTRTESASIPVDADEVPYAVADIPLDELRASRKAYIAAKRYEAEIGGVTLNGIHIGTDREDQAMITGASVAFSSGAISSLKWKSQAGFVTLDAQTFGAVASAVATHIQDCFTTESELSADIDAATTAEDILAVDWPA
jgi:hypothetical protein